MKKVMVVMTIIAALSFLVSMIAVSPSFAKQATKTLPTATQQTPAKVAVAQMPKAKFWDLELDHCVIKSGANPCTSTTINLKWGTPFNGTCFYKVKTYYPINDITEADAKAWGKGKSYMIIAYMGNGPDVSKFFKKEETRTLPKFTWQDVQQWKNTGQVSAPKIWTERLDFSWHPTKEQIGTWSFGFSLDVNGDINEYLENNNHCLGGAYINITP